ncbi:TPA: hypothetical protein IUV20_002584 [Enterococcus faecalis]|nr:hypothetical protein [Enterococcus faecalis]
MKNWRWDQLRRYGLVVLLSMFVLFYGCWLAQRQQIKQQFVQVEQRMAYCQEAAKQSKINETTIEELVQWHDEMRTLYYELNTSFHFFQVFTEKQDQKRFEKNIRAFFTYTNTYQQPLVREAKKAIGMKEGFLSFGEYQLYSFLKEYE